MFTSTRTIGTNTAGGVQHQSARPPSVGISALHSQRAMPPFQHRVLVEQPEFHPCRDNTHAFYFIGFEEQGTVIYRPALVGMA